MSLSRRQFLGAAVMLGAASRAGGIPVPLRAFAPTPRPGAPSNVDPPLPAGALQRLGSMRFRVDSYIHRLQFAADSSTLVAATRSDIRGWDPATGRIVFSIPYPSGYDLKNGRITNRKTISGVATVDGSNDFVIVQLPFGGGPPEARAGTSIATHESSVFSADGRRVCILSGGRLHMQDGMATRELWSKPFESDNATLHQFCFAASDQLLAHCDLKKLLLYETENGKPRDPLPMPKRGKRSEQGLSSLVASCDGSVLACWAGDEEKELLVWKLPECELIQAIPIKDAGTLEGLSADASTIYMMGEGELLHISVASGKPTGVTDTGPAGVRTLAPDGRLLAVECDESVFLLETATGRISPASADPPGLPHALEFNDENNLVGTLQHYGGWMHWNLHSGTAELIRPVALKDGSPIGLSRDRSIAAIGEENGLRLWRAAEQTNRLLKHEFNQSSPVAAFSADGGTLVAQAEGGLMLWRLPNDKPVKLESNNANHDASGKIVLSADGSLAVVFSLSGNQFSSESLVEAFSTQLGRSLYRFNANNTLGDIKVSPDGAVLAASARHTGNDRWDSDQRMLLVFDLRNGGRLARIESEQPINNFALSPDGRLLAAAVGNSILHIYEIASSGLRLEYTLPGSANALAFSPDASRLAVACTGGPVLIYDARGTRSAQPNRPGDERLATLLTRLGSTDAAEALTALHEAAAWPNDVLPLLAAGIRAVPKPDMQKIRGCIDKLGAPAFVERDRATRELLELGELALPEIRKVLASTTSEEIRSRAESIVNHNGAGSAADLLALRAVEAAEWIGTPSAKTLVTELAAGADGARLTREARAALQRMK